MSTPPPIDGDERASTFVRVVDERGGSLLEVLIAVAIVSILLLGVMAGMSTSATVSRSTGQAAKTRSALAMVADRIATMEYPPMNCGDAAALTTWVQSHVVVPTGYTVQVTAVEDLLPPSPCVDSTSVRKLTVRIDHAESSSTRSGDVVMRNPAAKPS